MRARVPSLAALATALVAAAAARAQVASTTPGGFERGVAAYEQGHYAEAERAFRDLLVNGEEHPTVLFNLGDAAYRQGKWAVAVYAYEWALSLDPGDKDAQENLDLARAKLVADQVPSNVSESMAKALDVLGRIPPLLTSIAFLVLWTAGWGLLALRVWRGSPTLAWGVALLLASLVFGAHVVYDVVVLRGPPHAVIQSAEVEIKSGPSPSYTTLFTLHAGTGVRRLDTRGGWSRIEIPHGPGGWIPSEALAVIGHPETLPPMDASAAP